MRPLSRRSFLRTASIGSAAAATAVLGSHIPDFANNFLGEDVDLSGFDVAYILDTKTGLYTISSPKSNAFPAEVVDLKTLNTTFPFSESPQELPVIPKVIEDSIAYYSSIFTTDNGYEAEILVGPNQKLVPIPGGTSIGEAWQFGRWPLSVSGGIHYGGYVGGCVRRNVNHADFRITQYGSNVVYVGIHIASWYEPGRQCFGIWESVTGWSYCACVPNIDFWSMAHAVNSAIQAGLPWYLDNLSWAVAIAAVPLVIGALIVIPAVPPPP